MMTNDMHYRIASIVARDINTDIDRRPHFTLTRSQLFVRCDRAADHPDITDTDIHRIFNTLIGDPIIFRRLRD